MRRIRDLSIASLWRFYDDGCFMRASALAYVSLLSLVPVLAVMFSVLKGLGVQRRLEPLLLSRLSLQPNTIQDIVGYIDRTNFRTLGAFGAIALLFTVYSLLNSIEASFNHLWRVAHGRNYWQQVTHYFGVVLLAPFLLLGAVAITSSFQVRQLIEWARASDILGDAVVGALGLAPVAMNIVALAVLYAVIPNRRPYWPSVMLGSFVAGIAWYVVQIAYLRLQIGVARYNAIYGALSQLPITLVWQYLSWVVVLAGAEIAVVYEFGRDAARGDGPLVPRIALALELLHRCAFAFAGGGSPVTVRDVARDLRAPIEEVQEVTAWLVEQGWVAAVEGSEPRYLLARDGKGIRLDYLADLGGDLLVSPRCSKAVSRGVVHLASVQRDRWAQLSLAELLSDDSSVRRVSP